MGLHTIITPPTHLARELQSLRLRRRKTVAEMSEALGKHPSFWHKYETGERRMGLGTLAILAARIGLADTDLRRIIRAFAADLGEV